TSELISEMVEPCAERDQRSASAAKIAGAPRGSAHGGVVCYPEQLSVLGRIFDEAVAALPENMRTPENRAELAKLILGRAAVKDIELSFLIGLISAIVAAV